MVRVAALQHDIAWEDRDATLARLEPKVAEAAAAGARLVVLPETFAVGFSMATERTAEPVDGPTATWLGEQALLHGAWIGGSVPERAEGSDRPANTFVLAAPDGTRHRYAKRNLFTYGHEDDAFVAGDERAIVEVEGLRCSLVVCYDLRFGDQLWAQAADVDCYLIVANWPEPRQHHWRTLLAARAIENLAYVVGVNRVGDSGDGVPHIGGSCILGPFGEVLADGGAEESMLLADLDPEVVAATRQRYPFLADRR